MTTRQAEAVWEGSLKNGRGHLAAQSGIALGKYSANSRFESEAGTNPEELAAAAHAGCFSMALSHVLAEAGHAADQIKTTATVHLESANGGFRIPRIDLRTRALVPGIDVEAFQTHARRHCPISNWFYGGVITLEATLE